MSLGTRASFRRVALEAAAELFASRDDVSMSQLAEAIGVGRATLYRHYDSREALLRDLAAFAFDDARRALDEAHLDEVDVAEGFERAFRALVHIGSRYAVVTRDKLSMPDDEARIAIGVPLRTLVARGQEDGTLRADVPAEWLLFAMKGAILSAVELAQTAGVEDAAAFGARQFLNGARSA